jgi:choline dehydrogenase-like flavoprotein
MAVSLALPTPGASDDFHSSRDGHEESGEGGSVGASGWSYADLAPYFRRIEGCADGNGTAMGQAGPVNIESRAKHGINLGARREVILSASSVETPKLLMLSGIGPEDHLREVGVPVRHALPGVGGGFHDHVSVAVPFETRRRCR